MNRIRAIFQNNMFDIYIYEENLSWEMFTLNVNNFSFVFDLPFSTAFFGITTALDIALLLTNLIIGTEKQYPMETVTYR